MFAALGIVPVGMLVGRLVRQGPPRRRYFRMFRGASVSLLVSIVHYRTHSFDALNKTIPTPLSGGYPVQSYKRLQPARRPYSPARNNSRDRERRPAPRVYP
jgi:hypothetical protein